MVVKSLDVQAIAVAVPICAPILTCYGAQTHCNRTVIRITGDDGTEGLAEASAWVTPVKVQALRGKLVGSDPRLFDPMTARLDNWNYHQGNELLVLAIELAYLDVSARLSGQRLCDYLGGALREEIPVAQYLLARYDSDDFPALADADATLAEARRGLETTGMRVLRYEGGHLSPAEDIELMRPLATVEGAVLRIDPEGSWSPATAANSLRAMRKLSIEYIELPVWGARAMSELRRLSGGLPFATNMMGLTSMQHLVTAATSTPASRRHLQRYLVDAAHRRDHAQPQARYRLQAHAPPRRHHRGQTVHGARRCAHRAGRAGVMFDEDKLAEYDELAVSEKFRDRYLDPSPSDAPRPKWFPVQPKW